MPSKELNQVNKQIETVTVKIANLTAKIKVDSELLASYETTLANHKVTQSLLTRLEAVQP